MFNGSTVRRLNLRRIVAAVATILILAGAVGGMLLRSGIDRLADTPEACLERMVQAMNDGNVALYLDSFTGELRQRLESTAKEQTYKRFARYLGESAEPIKGQAILRHKTEHAGADRVRMVVERVYAERQWEYQTYRLRNQAGVWRIYQIDPAQLFDPPVPYGTPVFPQPQDTSESPPGQAGL